MLEAPPEPEVDYYQDFEQLNGDVGLEVSFQVPQYLLEQAFSLAGGAIEGKEEEFYARMRGFPRLTGIVTVDPNESDTIRVMRGKRPDGSETAYSPIFRNDADVKMWQVLPVLEAKGDPERYPVGSIEREIAVQLMDMWPNRSASDLALWVEILSEVSRKDGLKKPQVIHALGGLSVKEYDGIRPVIY